MSAPSNILRVSLGEKEVGHLELEGGGYDRITFRTTARYRQMRWRPIISQSLEDDLGRTWESRIRAPPFFSNLLPEGVLRELLAQRAGVNPMREFFLLAQLGGDLPGNVVVEPIGPLSDEGPASAALPGQVVSADEALRFSVAGLQLKVSVSPKGKGWVIPVRGSGGRWLLKLPSPRFKAVPLNELWTMRFARSLGLDVADVEPVSLHEVEGLAEVVRSDLLGSESHGLLVRRFDRTEGVTRVHTEDLLQVLNKHPDDSAKYRAANAEWVGRLLRVLDPGGRDLEEFVKRLVFNALMGNGDAHLKNWMLRYEDPRIGRLAPAFDLLSTIQFPETDQMEFALNLGRTKRYEEFDGSRLLHFARHLHVPGQADVEEDVILRLAREFANRLTDSWSEFARENQVDAGFSSTLEKHWQRVPLIGD